MKPYIIRRLIAVALLAFWIIVALAVYFIVR
nr:MAG TPA: Reaction center protein H chain, membrane protein, PHOTOSYNTHESIS [Caudoviricetes sp.]